MSDSISQGFSLVTDYVIMYVVDSSELKDNYSKKQGDGDQKDKECDTKTGTDTV